MSRKTKLPAILLFCSVFAGSAFASSQSDIVDAFNLCINNLLSQQKQVYTNDPISLKQQCPNLLPFLDQPDLAHFSPPLQDKTSFSQLLDISRTLENSRKIPNTNKWELDHAGLDSLLDEVYVQETDKNEIKSFTDIFWDWVAENIRKYFDSDNWFTRNLDTSFKPGDGFFEGLKNTVVVILIAFILYIIINELYAANISKYFARRKARKAIADDRHESTNNPLYGLNDILQLSIRQQVPALLRYSLQILIKKGVIPKRYSLTNQEFLKIARNHLPELSRDLEIIVNTSDKVLYGNKTIAAGDASRLFERVRKIENLRYRPPS